MAHVSVISVIEINSVDFSYECCRRWYSVALMFGVLFYMGKIDISFLGLL